MITAGSVLVKELVARGEAELTTGPFGTQLKAAEYVPVGIPVINVRNVGFGNIRADKLEFVSDATADRLDRHRLQACDIVFGRKGAVERHGFIQDVQAGWLQGSDCLRLRLRSPRFNPRFVSYFLLTEHHKQWMINHCSHGATMASLNQDILGRIELPLRPRLEQDRIVAVLSVYDDLIGNNTRRIQILEEMAQAIYQEWFVEFRYPGHEDVPLVDSDLGRVPKGWRALTWGDLATLDYGRALRGYKDATAGYPVFGTNGPIGWHDAPLFGPGVVVGRKGAYRGIHFSTQPCWVIDTAFYLNIRDAKQIDPLFAYYQLRTVDLDSIDSGSAIPSTSRDAFYAIRLVVPPADIVQRFSDMARDMFYLQRTLENSSAVLRTTRDLLLPRLMSGEIDMSELDLQVADAAA